MVSLLLVQVLLSGLPSLAEHLWHSPFPSVHDVFGRYWGHAVAKEEWNTGKMQADNTDTSSAVGRRREILQSSTSTEYCNYWCMLKQSLGKFVVGVILLCLAAPTITYGEGSYVHRQSCLEWCEKELKKSGGQKTSDGLVYTNGELVPSEPSLSLPLFGINVENALRLRVKVEMYQNYVQARREQRKDRVGGGQTTTTTYDVKQRWAEEDIDPNPSDPHSAANMTGAPNPPFPLQLGKTRCMQKNVYINEYSLSQEQIERLTDWKQLPPPHISIIQPHLWNSEYSSPPVQQGNYLYFPQAGRGHSASDFISKPKASAYDTAGYGAQQDIEAQYSAGVNVGDVRVSFDKIDGGCTYSIIAGVAFDQGPNASDFSGEKKVSLDTFQVMKYGEFKVPPCCAIGCCAVFNVLGAVANDVDEMQSGRVPYDEMLKKMKEADYVKLKIMRVVGFLMFFGGFYLIFQPVIALLSVVKIIGSIVSVGIWLFALVFGALMTVLTISLAWLYYRPLKAILLAGVSVGLFFLISYLCTL